MSGEIYTARTSGEVHDGADDDEDDANERVVCCCVSECVHACLCDRIQCLFALANARAYESIGRLVQPLPPRTDGVRPPSKCMAHEQVHCKLQAEASHSHTVYSGALCDQTGNLVSLRFQFVCLARGQKANTHKLSSTSRAQTDTWARVVRLRVAVTASIGNLCCAAAAQASSCHNRAAFQLTQAACIFSQGCDEEGRTQL